LHQTPTQVCTKAVWPTLVIAALPGGVDNRWSVECDVDLLVVVVVVVAVVVVVDEVVVTDVVSGSAVQTINIYYSSIHFNSTWA